MTAHDEIQSLSVSATPQAKAEHYEHVIDSIIKVLEGEDDWVAAMSTVASLLHSAFDYFHWTGFYQAGPPGADTLIIGPYQGHLGCLRIPFSRGVCGAAARSRETQLVPDVSQFPGYIACASSTQSEVVVPVLEAGSGRLRAVLDIDSDLPAAFTQVDKEHLERLCAWLGSQRQYWKGDD